MGLRMRYCGTMNKTTNQREVVKMAYPFSVTPSKGPEQQETEVVLGNGDVSINWPSVTEVLFAGVPATKIHVVEDSLYCLTPAMDRGFVDVTLVNSEGPFLSRTDAYKFTATQEETS